MQRVVVTSIIRVNEVTSKVAFIYLRLCLFNKGWEMFFFCCWNVCFFHLFFWFCWKVAEQSWHCRKSCILCFRWKFLPAVLAKWRVGYAIVSIQNWEIVEHFWRGAAVLAVLKIRSVDWIKNL